MRVILVGLEGEGRGGVELPLGVPYKCGFYMPGTVFRIRMTVCVPQWEIIMAATMACKTEGKNI